MTTDATSDAAHDGRPSGRPRRATGPDAQARLWRRVTWAVSIFAAVLLINAVVGDNGYLATIRARREEAALTADVARLRLENARLIEQAHRLQDDPAAVEEVARERNYLRPGETLVIVHDKTPAR